MKYFWLFIIFLVLLMKNNVSIAMPTYYTWEAILNQGQIDYYETKRDAAGIIKELSIKEGDVISYTFLVDLEKTGYIILNDGSAIKYNDNASQDYFYVEYISGSRLQEKNGGVHNNSDDIAEYHYGTRFGKGPDATYLIGGSADSVVYIGFGNSFFNEWETGQTGFWLRSSACDDQGNYSFLGSGSGIPLELTAIRPVPEPTTMLLFGTGLIGLAAVGRRKRY